jgi:hypothetical protein
VILGLVSIRYAVVQFPFFSKLEILIQCRLVKQFFKSLTLYPSPIGDGMVA